MREIKFRLFDKTNGTMIYQGDKIYMNLSGKIVFERTDTGEIEEAEDGTYEILEFTGLRDKNGKEIYDGDILKDIENNNIEEVKGFDFSFGWKQHLNYKEVIGNIHENGTCKVTPDGALGITSVGS